MYYHMTQILDEKTCKPTMFEPKVGYRFLVQITNGKDNVLIPSFVICKIDRPSFSYTTFGFKKYDILKLSMYDPIVPSTMLAVTNAIDRKAKWDINIRILGPVGDVVEEWGISNAKLVYVKPSSMSWQEDGDPALVDIGFKISEVVHYY